MSESPDDRFRRLVDMLDREDAIASNADAGVPPEALPALEHLAPLPWFDAAIEETLQRRIGAFDIEALAPRIVDGQGGARRVEPGFARDWLERRFGLGEDGASLSDVRGFAELVLPRFSGADHTRLLCALDPVAGGEELERDLGLAFEAFDLVAAERLLVAVEGRPRLGEDAQQARLDDKLLSARRSLENRARFHAAFYRTSRYQQRGDLHKAIRDFWSGGQARVLHLYAGGGTGKSVFFQWLVARELVPAGATIATFDFDRFQAENIAPAAVALKLAAQLDGQLRDASGRGPFESILLSSGERHAEEFLAFFGKLLGGAQSRGPILLLFDTLEDVMDRPELAELLTVLWGAMRENTMLRLITGGRFALSERVGRLWQAIPAELRPIELALRRFTRGEAVRYLRERCGVLDPCLARAIARRAGGLPFKLALWAELTSVGEWTAGKVAEVEHVDLEFLIERIISRLEPQLQWAVRYSAIPNRLDREIFEVLVPHILVQSRTQALDRPGDALPTRQRERAWPTTGADVLWDDLVRYQGSASWLTFDAETQSCNLHPDVREPLRALLFDQRITPLIHRDLAALFADRASRHAEALSAANLDACRSWALAQAEYFFHRWNGEEDVAGLPVALIDAARLMKRVAPAEVRRLAGVPFDEPNLGCAAVRRSKAGSPWVNPLQAATLLLLLADASWTLARAGGGGARARRVDATTILARVDRGLLEPTDRARYDVLAAELAGSPVQGFSDLDESQKDLETRYRELELRKVDGGYRAALSRLFQEALGEPTVPPDVRDAIAGAFLRTALEFDAPLDAVAAAERIGSSQGPLTWFAMAESYARVGRSLPPIEGLIEPARRLFEARRVLRVEHPDTAAWPLSTEVLALLLEAEPDLREVALVTQAEYLARRGDLAGLDALARFAATRGAPKRWVHLWLARLNRVLGRVEQARGDLNGADELFADVSRAFALTSDLDFAVRLLRRQLAVDAAAPADEVARADDALAALAATGRARHRYGLALARGDAEATAAAEEAIQSEVNRRTLRRLYLGGFSEEEARRVRELHGVTTETVRMAIGFTASVTVRRAVVLEPANGPLAAEIAARPLGASRTDDDLARGALVERVVAEALAGRDLELHEGDSLGVSGAPSLLSLPLEQLPRPAGVAVFRQRRSRRPRRDEPLATPEVELLDQTEGRESAAIARSWGRALALRTRTSLAPTSAPLVHVRGGHFEPEGRSVNLWLRGTSLLPPSFARLLEERARVLVIELGSDETSPDYFRDLMLCNAFVAELFELVPIEVIVALPRLAQRHRFPASLAELDALVDAFAALARGASTPLELLAALRHHLDTPTLALSCDDPAVPFPRPTWTEA